MIPSRKPINLPPQAKIIEVLNEYIDIAVQYGPPSLAEKPHVDAKGECFSINLIVAHDIAASLHEEKKKNIDTSTVNSLEKVTLLSKSDIPYIAMFDKDTLYKALYGEENPFNASSDGKRYQKFDELKNLSTKEILDLIEYKEHFEKSIYAIKNFSKLINIIKNDGSAQAPQEMIELMNIARQENMPEFKLNGTSVSLGSVDNIKEHIEKIPKNHFVIVQSQTHAILVWKDSNEKFYCYDSNTGEEKSENDSESISKLINYRFFLMSKSTPEQEKISFIGFNNLKEKNIDWMPPSIEHLEKILTTKTTTLENSITIVDDAISFERIDIIEFMMNKNYVKPSKSMLDLAIELRKSKVALFLLKRDVLSTKPSFQIEESDYKKIIELSFQDGNEELFNIAESYYISQGKSKELSDISINHFSQHKNSSEFFNKKSLLLMKKCLPTDKDSKDKNDSKVNDVILSIDKQIDIIEKLENKPIKIEKKEQKETKKPEKIIFQSKLHEIIEKQPEQKEEFNSMMESKELHLHLNKKEDVTKNTPLHKAFINLEKDFKAYQEIVIKLLSSPGIEKSFYSLNKDQKTPFQVFLESKNTIEEKLDLFFQIFKKKEDLAFTIFEEILKMNNNELLIDAIVKKFFESNKMDFFINKLNDNEIVNGDLIHKIIDLSLSKNDEKTFTKIMNEDRLLESISIYRQTDILSLMSKKAKSCVKENNQNGLILIKNYLDTIKVSLGKKDKEKLSYLEKYLIENLSPSSNALKPGLISISTSINQTLLPPPKSSQNPNTKGPNHDKESTPTDNPPVRPDHIIK